jgi:hypothetical protein
LVSLCVAFARGSNGPGAIWIERLPSVPTFDGDAKIVGAFVMLFVKLNEVELICVVSEIVLRSI